MERAGLEPMPPLREALEDYFARRHPLAAAQTAIGRQLVSGLMA